MTVLQTMWDKAVIVRMRAWRIFVLGTVLASLLLVAAPRALALDPNRRISQYGHTTWRVQDGSISPAGSITQTTDGYIWVATSAGLMRFDGVRFVPWVASKGAPPIRKVTFLLGARDDSLWIGTTSSLNRLKDGQLQSYTKPTDRSGIGAIFEDHAGTIWVTRYRVPKGEGPLCRVAGKELQCFGKADGIPVTYGLGLTQDTLGNLWFGSSVLCRWRPGSSSTYFDDVLKNKKVGEGVERVAPGESGSVWASIDGIGPQLGVRYYSDGKWADYVVTGFDGATVRSHALFVDRNKSLWVGTENNGLYRVSDSVADHYGSADGLSGNSVGLVYEDREGNLWVVTEGGVDMFRDTPVVSFSIKQGLSGTTIPSILALRNGSVWIGNEGAVDIVRGGRNSSLSAGQGLPGQDVAALFEGHNGGVWLGVDNKLLTYKSGRFREVRRSDGSALAGHEEVIAITEDVDHNIWALTGEHHVFRIANDKVEEDIPLSGNLLPSAFLAADREAGFWISTASGTVAHYRDGHVVQTISLEDSDDPFLTLGLIVDSDNSLLVPSVRGLFRWNDGRWSVLDARNGLPCGSISAAVKDNYGSLWLYAQCGLLKVEAPELAKWRERPDSQLAFQLFDPLDGAHPGYKVPLQPESSKAPDGHLWFTNGEIAQMIDPDRLYRNGIPPPVYIEEVIADHKTYAPQSRLHLPALTRDIEIDYTALSFVVPQKVHFQYKLEGYDRDWQDAVTRRQAFYSNLLPGNYTFRVKACNNSGLWNEAGASLDFFVAPAFYQTVWFRLSGVAAFFALLVGVYHLRLMQLAREFNVRVEERVRERTRIARELHDSLLQSFQGLMFRLQAVRDLLSERSSEVIEALDIALERGDRAIAEGRDTVSDLRESIVGDKDVADALTALGEELTAQSDGGTSPFVRVLVEGKPRELDPLLRDEIYRIAREALRNALRHAKAQTIEAEITYGESEFLLHVRDDGGGIAPQVANSGARAGHWGLPGMRERAKSFGGKLEVWSQHGAGTEIELTVPASIAYRRSKARRRFSFWRKKIGETDEQRT